MAPRSNASQGNTSKKRGCWKQMWPEIKGKIVYAPANHFGMNIPGLFYRAKVVRKDKRRREAVIIKLFEDDNSQYWIPMEVVHNWVQLKQPLDGLCTHKETDSYAAAALVHLRSPLPLLYTLQPGKLRAEGQENQEEEQQSKAEDIEIKVSTVLIEMASESTNHLEQPNNSQ